MTKQELTGVRELNFSQWVRKELPDSDTGFMATDLDFFLYNYKTQKMMMIEIKTRNSQIKKWQSSFFYLVEKWIKNGIDFDWEFLGFHVIVFENTCFADGKVYLDGKESSEREVKQFLSF